MNRDFSTMSMAEKVQEAKRREMRRANGLPMEETPAEALERIAEEDARLEGEIQQECWNELRAAGFTMYWLSQKRRTKQSPGLGDLYGVHEAKGVVVWVEVKTPTGRQRPAQVDFEYAHRYTHKSVTVVVGGVEAVRQYIAGLPAV